MLSLIGLSLIYLLLLLEFHRVQYYFIFNLHYVNDFFDIILYADDITLFNSLSEYNCPQDSNIINNELNKVYDWLTVN